MNCLKIAVIFCILLVYSCNDFEHGPLVSQGGVPGPVTNVEIVNMPGAAKIAFTLPNDPDLLYVKAVFSSKPGEERSVKSSLYNNFVLLEGFPDARPYDVTLYAVSKSEAQSEPVTVTVNPEQPRMVDVYQSLEVKPDFGGVNISLRNASREPYVFSTLVKNKEGTWDLYNRNHSSLDSLSYSVRGLDSIETEFGFFITDRWNNHSDTLEARLKPLYEELLNKKSWALAPLPSDFSTPFYPYSNVEHLWDEDVHQENGIYNYYYAHPVSAPSLPSWFTIDLGAPYKLSRMKVNQYEGAGSYMYTDGNPKVYEIWGNTEPDDNWDSWIRLQRCESIKPSGLPSGVRNAEDVAYAINGEDFGFSVDDPAVRYIRFKLIETWGSQPNLLLDEITFWGQKQ